MYLNDLFKKGRAIDDSSCVIENPVKDRQYGHLKVTGGDIDEEIYNKFKEGFVMIELKNLPAGTYHIEAYVDQYYKNV